MGRQRVRPVGPRNSSGGLVSGGYSGKRASSTSERYARFLFKFSAKVARRWTFGRRAKGEAASADGNWTNINWFLERGWKRKRMEQGVLSVKSIGGFNSNRWVEEHREFDTSPKNTFWNIWENNFRVSSASFILFWRRFMSKNTVMLSQMNIHIFLTTVKFLSQICNWNISIELAPVFDSSIQFSSM